MALVIFIFAKYFDADSEATWKNIPFVQVTSFLVFIWTIAKTINSSLLSGTAKAAQSFIEANSTDPMQKLSVHFRKMIEEIGYPIATFIDDLDRCNKDYGIKLLEGLQ